MKVKPRGELAAPTAKKCRRSKRSTSYRAEDDVKVHTGPSAEAAVLSVVPAGRVVHDEDQGQVDGFSSGEAEDQEKADHLI